MFDIDKFADTGQLFDNHYKLIRPLNTEGGTADVWLALDTSTVKDKEALDEAPFLDDNRLAHLGLLVAIKIYRPKNALDIEGERRFRDEFVIVFNCNHTNLIHPVHFSIFEETPYLVIPYCQRGSSELMIGNFVNDDDIWKYIRDVAGGLDYLHKCTPPIIHQDIKPANILIDDNGNYAITDFGISAKRLRRTTRKNNTPSATDSEEDIYEEYSGTYAYMAPERFVEGNMPSAESDIWAFGATLYEIITGSVPFGEEGGSAQGDGKINLSFSGLKISDDIKRLIADCLSKNPFGRPSAQQLLDAAIQKKYISGKKTGVNLKLVIGIACALITVALLAWNLIPNDEKTDNTDNVKAEAKAQIEEEPVKVVKSPEELFQDAMAYANASTADSVKTGIKLLENLADEEDYVPALFELAITYGGMASDDEMAYDRKKILGIKLGNDHIYNDPTMAQYTPSSNSDNEKAIGYYTRIIDLANRDYDDINMKSSYRLGYYYLCLNNDKKKALSLFKKTKEYAIANGNGDFQEESNNLIDFCQE